MGSSADELEGGTIKNLGQSGNLVRERGEKGARLKESTTKT